MEEDREPLVDYMNNTKLCHAVEDMILHGLIHHVDETYIEHVGSGGWAEVFRISADAKNWIVKVIHNEHRDPMDVAERERACMKRVRSAPSLMELVKQKHPYVLMEYIDGFPLIKLLHAIRSSTDQTRNEIGSCVATAFCEVPKARVAHGDIKPSNIMVGKDGNPKIIDFGMAMRLEGPELPIENGSTPLYMAPEQFEGELHLESDVFGLGATFFKFFSQDDIARLIRNGHVLLPSLRNVYKRADTQKKLDEHIDALNASEPWKTVLKGMLRVRMDERWPMENVSEELQKLSENTSPTLSEGRLEELLKLT